MCDVLMGTDHKALLAKSKTLPMPQGGAYHQAMLSTSQELAKRLQEAFARTGKTKAAFARECEQSPQALGGWLKTGRIDKSKLLIFARVANVPVEELLGAHPSPIEGDSAPCGHHVAEERAPYRVSTDWPFKSFTREEFTALPPDMRSSAEGYIQGLIAAAKHTKSDVTAQAA